MNESKQHNVIVRISQEQMELLRQLAKDNFRSVNGEVCNLIKKAVNESKFQKRRIEDKKL